MSPEKEKEVCLKVEKIANQNFAVARTCKILALAPRWSLCLGKRKKKKFRPENENERRGEVRGRWWSAANTFTIYFYIYIKN